MSTRIKDVARLAMMLSSDRPHGSVEVLHVHALSDGMLASGNVLPFVKDLYNAGITQDICFNGSNGSAALSAKPGSAWCGAREYIKRLTDLGVPKEHLIVLGDGMHTREETDKFVLGAREYGWERAACVTSAFHFVRVFSCLVQSMHDIGHRFPVWAICPPQTDWDMSILGSQGLKLTTPFESAIDEVDRTLQYIDKGYGASLDDVYAYLRSRPRS